MVNYSRECKSSAIPILEIPVLWARISIHITKLPALTAVIVGVLVDAAVHVGEIGDALLALFIAPLTDDGDELLLGFGAIAIVEACLPG